MNSYLDAVRLMNEAIPTQQIVVNFINLFCERFRSMRDVRELNISEQPSQLSELPPQPVSIIPILLQPTVSMPTLPVLPQQPILLQSAVPLPIVPLLTILLSTIPLPAISQQPVVSESVLQPIIPVLPEQPVMPQSVIPEQLPKQSTPITLQVPE